MPPDNGDAVFTLSVLETVARYPGTHVWAVSRVGTTESHVQALQALLGPVELQMFPPRGATTRSTLSAKAQRWARGLLTGTPPWIEQQFSQELLRELKATQFDNYLLVSAAAGIYALRTRLDPTHWDIRNVMTDSTRRELAQLRSPTRMVLTAADFLMSRRFEKDVLERMTTTSVTSSEEADRLRRLGKEPDFVLRPAISIPSENWEPTPAASEVLWLGSLTYKPNVDGLWRFLKEAAGVLEGLGVRVRVVGGGGTPRLHHHLRSHPLVNFVGYAEELFPEIRRCRAAVVPLWSGAGVKLKTLTLLSYGIPVAATPMAMEGVPRVAALSISPSSRHLVDAIATASVEQLICAGTMGRSVVTTEFSPESFTGRLSAGLFRNQAR